MAYTAVSSANTQAGKPVTEDTMTKFRTNQADFDARITANSISLENKYLDSVFNGSVKASISGTSLVIEVKDQSGTSDPSAGAPVEVMFRSSTATSGAYVQRTLTGATSLTIPSGGTLGGAAAGDRFYVYLIDNSGTPELAISNKIFPEHYLVSTTAVSASATSGSTLYSTSSRSSKGVRLIGRVDADRSGSDWNSVTYVFTSSKVFGHGSGATVGDIKTSMLTEAQYQGYNGVNWVLCDGDTHANSAYAAITGNSTVPDFRGEFLRGADNGRGVDSGRTLGSTQVDATAANGLSIPSGGTHTHGYISPSGGPGSYNGISYDSSLATSTERTGHITTTGSSHTHSITGDAETRPRNVAVNYFIMIDWL